jgi:hypothetical protein
VEKVRRAMGGNLFAYCSILIFVIGLTMLKMDKAKAKWRVKLQAAFDGQSSCFVFSPPRVWVALTR